MSSVPHFRILIVDDERDILKAYREILSPGDIPASAARLDQLAGKLFPSPQPLNQEIWPSFQLTCCRQGEEALAAVRESLKARLPFSAAFVDIRMPPGPDGVWTASRIRRLDEMINIVIVTAHSDVSPADIARRVPPLENLLYIQKPFHSHEIRQFATALSAKWQAERELRETNTRLEEQVETRTKELALTIEALEKSNQQYRRTAQELQAAEAELRARADDLTASNIALQQMMGREKKIQRQVEDKVLFTVHEMVEPYLKKLRATSLDEAQQSFIKIVEANLQEITAPFMKGLAQRYFRLTPNEIQIVNLIRQGKTTIQIAKALNTSKRNIDFYRDRIRQKMGIKNSRASLKTVLKDLGEEL
ncbi:MAG TPA: response regulator [Desulfobacterales bacterium]|nr:response regulator [Desulfobacterales bacterium]